MCKLCINSGMASFVLMLFARTLKCSAIGFTSSFMKLVMRDRSSVMSFLFFYFGQDRTSSHSMCAKTLASFSMFWNLVAVFSIMMEHNFFFISRTSPVTVLLTFICVGSGYSRYRASSTLTLSSSFFSGNTFLFLTVNKSSHKFGVAVVLVFFALVVIPAVCSFVANVECSVCKT